jgi:F-type H+-transporting ATPase subunit a
MHISLAAETIFHLGPIPVTNSFLTSMIATILLMIGAIVTGLFYKKLPNKLQSIFEMVYEMFENMAVEIIGESGKRYVPLIVTFFLYIIFSNWISLIPGVGSVGFNVMENGTKELVPFFRGGNADLNTTLALAIISVVAAQFYGIKASGIKNHLKHFKNPMEIISEISKIFSFSFRLFGNIFAGEVLLLVGASILILLTGKNATLFGFPGGLIQTPFYLFEVFVGFIQAFIFSVLSLVFISIYVQHKVD